MIFFDWIQSNSRVAAYLEDATPVTYSQVKRLLDKRSQHRPGEIVPIIPKKSLQSFMDIHSIIQSGAIPALGSPYWTQPQNIFQKLPKRWKLNHANKIILFSSGSTGEPKPLVLDIESMIQSALHGIPLSHDDVWQQTLPLFHIGGLAIIFRSWIKGAAVNFTSEELGSHIVSPLSTHVSFVPAQLERYIQSNQSQQLTAMVSGGALSEELINKSKNQIQLVRSYGLSELASQVSCTQLGGPEEDLLTSGYVLPHHFVKVEDGHLCFKSTSLFNGYVVNNSETFGDSVHLELSNGFWKSQDLGFLDSKNRLHVTGRADRQFKSLGELISPTKIEAAIQSFDGVKSATVWATPDLERGFVPAAYVEWSSSPLWEKLERHLKNHLNSLELPKFSDTPPPKSRF